MATVMEDNEYSDQETHGKKGYSKGDPVRDTNTQVHKIPESNVRPNRIDDLPNALFYIGVVVSTDYLNPCLGLFLIGLHITHYLLLNAVIRSALNQEVD